MPFTDSDVAEVRHVVQHILVPCIFVVGLLGNSVSIYVLTRKRMRCTTNIYLTALAITDILYLVICFLLSLAHYESVQRNFKFYYQNFMLFMWLIDASAYISTYIAVCFTIERFIAIRYPLKRQTFCTELLAKKIVAGVAIFCLLSTFSIAFEHSYDITSKLVDREGRLCKMPDTESPEMVHPSTLSALFENNVDSGMVYGSGSGAGVLQSDDNVSMERRRRRRNEINLSAANIPNIESSKFLLDAEYLTSIHASSSAAVAAMATKDFAQKLENFGVHKNDSGSGSNSNSDGNGVGMTATVDYCQNVTYYKNKVTSLGENTLYKSINYYFTTLVFVVIPLFVLSTFNFFLVMQVRRSKNLRGEMTNASSLRRPRKSKSTVSSVSQENRVTITLIAVVLLFIFCQLPWATYLIVTYYIDVEPHLASILGNILNLLVMINAAANFFLYCVLSDKYRKTVRELIIGFRYGNRGRNNNNTASLYTSSSTTMMASNGSRRYRPTIIK